MFIDGFALAGYRSFGPQLQQISPLGKLNFFVGPNNSGKSNILRFVHKHLRYLVSPGIDGQNGDGLDLSADRPQSSTPMSFRVGLSEHSNSEYFASIEQNLKVRERECLGKLLTSNALAAEDGSIWFYRTSQAFGKNPARWHPNHVDGTLVSFYESALPQWEWQLLWQAMFPHQQGGEIGAWIDAVLSKLDSFSRRREFPPVALVPAIRQIVGGPSDVNDFSGLGLINRLAHLQHPQYHERHLRSQFDTINDFLREVTANSSAELEVPHNHSSIQIHMDGRHLPLESLGTGIQEVIILAAVCTTLENQIVCLEEPELHLHPVLQRKLVRYLAMNTTNQYFISTHSAHMMDLSQASVFRVQLQDGFTSVSQVTTSHSKWEVCRDLGYRASDVVQANCIIWVEGPSDRVYLNHWIQAVTSDLVEGAHYSIMFYGGRLLNHLTMDDPEVTEFISLSSLNRHSAIVIDSDRKNSKTPLNRTKERVMLELQNKDLLAWITAGREIENYLPTDIIRKAIDAVAPGLGAKARTGRYETVLPASGSKKSVDKLKVAHKVTTEAADLDCFDLRERISELVAFIMRAN